MKTLSLALWQRGYSDAVHGFEPQSLLSKNKHYINGYKEGESSIEEFGFLEDGDEYYSDSNIQTISLQMFQKGL